MKLSKQIQRWRKRENISQSQAAIKIGVPVATLQNWEQGRNQPQGLAGSAIREITSKGARR